MSLILELQPSVKQYKYEVSLDLQNNSILNLIQTQVVAAVKYIVKGRKKIQNDESCKLNSKKILKESSFKFNEFLNHRSCSLACVHMYQLIQEFTHHQSLIQRLHWHIPISIIPHCRIPVWLLLTLLHCLILVDQAIQHR